MTLPNKITLGRIFAMPIILGLFYANNFRLFLWGFILAFIFGLSDYLDGYLARRLGQVSTLGKIIDPIADKLFVLLLCLYFVHMEILPAWVLILLICRELAISDFRLWAQRYGKEVAVSEVGKWKATFQFLLLGYLGAVKIFLFNHPQLNHVHAWPLYFQIGYYFFLVVALLLTLFSLAEYFWNNRNLFSSASAAKG